MKRKRIAVFGATALLVCACSAAWSWADAAPQWALDAAKVATPANVGDAAAVLLSDDYLITVDADNHAIERERFAVRILQPQGRKYARCDAEYDNDEKLNYFRAWTIAADGKQFQARDRDFLDQGAYDGPILQFTERIKSLKPPAADPGAVVTCEIEKHLRPYIHAEIWQLQYTIPVVHESLELQLPPGGHYAESWSRFEKQKPIETGPEHLRWEVHDVPALNLENLRATPAWEALAGRTEIKWGDMAVNGVDAQWRVLGQWQDQLDEHRTDPTPEIAAQVQTLVAGAPDLYTKLSRITSYIQKNVRYFIVVKGIGGWQPHYAGDIFRNQYGDCKDKTTILISMLQVIGIKAHYLMVDSERGVVDPTAPSTYGDHMITAIELPESENDPRLMARTKTAAGKTMLIFDPTDEVTPVGLIRQELQGAYGSFANGENSQVLAMPVLPSESAGTDRKGSFSLGADGLLSGEVEESLTGDDAARSRWMLKEEDGKDVRNSLEKAIATQLPGLVFQGYDFHRAADLDQPLGLDLHLSAANYGHTSGPLLLLKPRVIGSDARDVPDVMESKTRTFPIEMGHPGRWHDSFDISLPDGYVVDELPDAVNVDMDFASYHSSATAKGNVLHYEREYVVRQVELPASRAGDYRKLESAIVEDEHESAVLKKQ